MSLDLGAKEDAKLPTDQRIRNFPRSDDPALVTLYFQYGRFLLIGSSRTGGEPANLQGIWNNETGPAWGSKYTININTEMNYWPVNNTNLGECVEPLMAMVEELQVTGAKTAKTMYNAKGWVAHHNTDLWRASAPIDFPGSGMWPTGGAWLCNTLWDHYEFSQDQAFLKRLYPPMKGAAEFFLDTLVEEPKHKWLVTSPSLSPEVSHPGGGSVVAGPTSDMQMLRDLFAHCIEASQLLGVDESFRKQLVETRPPPGANQIGSGGQLQEWLDDWDLTAPDQHNRHVSHLYGLYPGEDISYGTDKAVRGRRQDVAQSPRRQRDRLGPGLAAQPVGPPARRRAAYRIVRNLLNDASRVPASTTISSTPIRPSRSTATSAAPQASPRRSCNPPPPAPISPHASSCFPRCRPNGRPAKSPASAPAAASRWTSSGRTASWSTQPCFAGRRSLPASLRRRHSGREPGQRPECSMGRSQVTRCSYKQTSVCKPV